MCTTSLHSKLCKIVLRYECTRIIRMDYLLQNYFALIATRDKRYMVIMFLTRIELLKHYKNLCFFIQ